MHTFDLAHPSAAPFARLEHTARVLPAGAAAPSPPIAGTSAALQPGDALIEHELIRWADDNELEEIHSATIVDDEGEVTHVDVLGVRTVAQLIARVIEHRTQRLEHAR